MIASKVFALVAFAVSTYAATVGPASAQNTSVVNYVPFTSLGNVAAGELFGSRNAQTRLIYQDSTGAIAQYRVMDGPFTTGHTAVAPDILVPASEAILRGTPIAFTAIDNADRGFHIYFLSPSRTLREYRWNATLLGRYGSGTQCPDCIDNMGYSVTAGSDYLYALENPQTNVLRVGFVSPGVPGTLCEAVQESGATRWQLAPLPN